MNLSRYSKEQYGGGKKKAMPFKAVWKSDTQWESSQMVGGRLLKKEQESPQMLGMLKVLGKHALKGDRKKLGHGLVSTVL